MNMHVSLTFLWRSEESGAEDDSGEQATRSLAVVTNELVSAQ